MEKPHIIFLTVSLLLPWVLVPHSLQMEWERAWSCSRFCWWMVWSPQLPKALEGVTETHFQQGSGCWSKARIVPDHLVLQEQLFSHPAWLIRTGTHSGSVYVARSQLSPVTDHWVRVLFYANSCLKAKRGCVHQACLLCYPSQCCVVLKAIFRSSCEEHDKSNIKVYWLCTAALKLSPEEETALPSCRGPGKWGLGQKSRL